MGYTYTDTPYLDIGGTKYLVSEMKEYINKLVLGEIDINLDDYSTTEQIQTMLDALEIQINIGNYTTKAELQQALANVQIDTTNYYTKSEVNALIPTVTNGRDGQDGQNGRDGRDGADGESAYTVWLRQGNVGSETDFLNSLKGNTGNRGLQGEKGENGVTFTPHVTDNTLSWTNDGGLTNPTPINIKGEKGDAGERGERGYAGQDGTDGTSAFVNVYKDEDLGKTVITCSDDSGVTIAEILDGAKGEKGDKGEDGTMTFSDLTPEQKVMLKGDKGDKGDTGEQGLQGIQGIKGDKGDDGYPFLIYKEYNDLSEFNEDDFPEIGLMFMIKMTDTSNFPIYRYTGEDVPYSFVTDLTGSTGIKGEKGEKGDQGEQGIQGEKGTDGVDGKTYTPTIGTVTLVDTVEETDVSIDVIEDINEAVFNFAIPKGQKGDTGEKGDIGDNGADGQDGFSPIVTVTETDKGHNVAIEDVNGVQNFEVLDGKDAEVTQHGLVSNAQNFKLDLTKNNASWYGMCAFNFVYGTTPCEITIAITDKVYYTITKGQNVVSAITYTQSGANYTIGIDLTAKVYGTQVVDMPSEFGVVNSFTAETYAGATTATISTISEEPIILRYNMSETFSFPKITGISG